MSENVIFQTKTFGGFDKKAVLEYIDRAAEKAKKTEEELSAQLKTMREKNRALEEERDALQGKLEDAGKQREELHAMLQKIEEELKACRAQKEEQDGQLALAVKQNLELRNALSLHQEKSRKYDEISSKLSETMLHAQKTAEDMVLEAQIASEKITSKTRQDCEEIKTKMRRFQKEVSDLKYCIGEAFASLDKQMELLSTAVDRVAGQLEEPAAKQEKEDSGSPLC